MPDTTLIRLAFLWGQGEVHGRQLDRRARTYEPLEQHRRIVWIAGGIVVGARTDVLVTTPVDEDGRRRDVVLFWTLVEPDRLAVERADGTVGRAQVDTDVQIGREACRGRGWQYE